MRKGSSTSSTRGMAASRHGHHRRVRSQGQVRPLLRQGATTPAGTASTCRKEGGEEFLYLSDIHNRQVVKTNLKGEELWKSGFPEEAKVYKDKNGYRPTNVAFAPDGGFYVGDGYGSNYIHQYDKDAKWVRTWGGSGKEPGKMQTPHGLWLDNRPGREASLVVADRANAACSTSRSTASTSAS